MQFSFVLVCFVFFNNVFNFGPTSILILTQIIELLHGAMLKYFLWITVDAWIRLINYLQDNLTLSLALRQYY